MKQKLRKVFLLFTFIMAGILFYSCQKDDQLEQINRHENLKFVKRNLNELFKEKQFTTAFQKIPKKKKNTTNALSKTVMEEEYGFTIIGNIANEIITDSITSYTLKIRKNDTNHLENLIVQTNNFNPNGVKAFIFEYLNPYTEHYTGDVKVTPIVYNANQVATTTARVKYECTTVVFPCVNHPSGPAEGQTCDGPTTKTYCYYTGGGGGGGADTGGGDTSGGGTPTSDPAPPPPTENHDPVYTVPVDEGEQPDPCASLKRKYADPSKVVIKNKTNALGAPLILNTNHESGFGITLSDDPLNPEKTVTLEADGNNAVKIAGVGAYFTAHVHNNDYTNANGDLIHTVKIPAPGDFEALFNDHVNNAQNMGIPLSEVGVVVVTSQGTYALMLEDFNVDAFIVNYGPNANPINMADFKNDYKKEVEDKVNIGGNLNATFLEEMLLNLMKDNNIKDRIGLYKATNSDRTAWAKLAFNDRTNQIEPLPCN